MLLGLLDATWVPPVFLLAAAWDDNDTNTVCGVSRWGHFLGFELVCDILVDSVLLWGGWVTKWGPCPKKSRCKV